MGSASRALVPLLAIPAIAPLPLFGQTGELSAGRSPAPACAAREAKNARPFDETHPEVLVGHYELTMVSTWEEAAGRWSRGELQIWRTPGGMVQGSSDIDLDSLRVPGMVMVGDSLLWYLGSGDIASRDTLSPGLEYHSSGLVVDAGFLLAPVWTYDVGAMSYLEVDSVSDAGFWGRWNSELFGITSYDEEGRVLPNPNGTFCATRSAGDLEDGEGTERIQVDAEEGSQPSSESASEDDGYGGEVGGALIGSVISFYGLGILLGGGSMLFLLPGALIGMGIGSMF